MLKSSKAQVWYTDFVVSVLIFVIALVIYFEYVNNLSKEEESNLEEMVMQAKAVSNNLMSEGYPFNWTADDVDIIGIVDSKRINQTKIEQFYSMNHSSAKIKFGEIQNYYFYLENRNGQKINVSGKNFAGREPINPTKLVKINRIIVYNSSTVKAVVQVWY